MSALTCVRARLRLQERGAGLSAADALRLEDHLAGCDECRDQAVLLDRLREVAHQFDGKLDSAARGRAITGAFARVAQQSLREQSARPLQLAWGVAAFAAGAALFFALRPEHGTAPTAETAVPAAGAVAKVAAGVETDDNGARVLAGSIEVDGVARNSGAALPVERSLYAKTGAELALGHARVSLRPETRVRWNAAAETLALETGSVLAEVDPSKHQRFSVQTRHFSAVVLGTRFEVTLEGVRVERGKVQVVSSDGRVLAAGLLAGESFALGEQAARVSGEGAGEEQAARSVNAAPATHAPAGSKLDAAAWLQRARAGLAARDPRGARKAVDAALALRPAKAVRAEALSLRAECSLVDGDVAAAVRQYLQVTDGFGRLPAAQNALFAAARLEAERGRRAHAAELFARYLARYPQGSLANDAARRLAALGGEVQERGSAR